MTPTLLTPKEYHERILEPVGRVVVGMERTGIPVDRDALRSIDAAMVKRAGEIRAELSQWCTREINWGSWQQLAKWLHEDLGLEESPYCKKGEVQDGKVSTDDRALEWLAGQYPDHRAPITALRKLRQCERMSRYARDWLDKSLPHPDGTWRLHPSFGLASDHDNRPGAVSGRFAVKNPPLNQVPRNPARDPAGMRSAFVPPPGYRLICIDFAQLEVVILGHVIATLFDTSDPLVTKLVAGEDIHGPAARYIFGDLAKDPSVSGIELADFKRLRPDLRDLAKIAIYGLNYGKGVKGFAWSTFLADGSPLGMDRAELLVDGLKSYYPGIDKYHGFVRRWIERYGNIATLFGRVRLLPGAKSSKLGLRNRAWRQALNHPFQGGGQEIMALALIAIARDRWLAEKGLVLSLVVHDEVVGWAPEDVADEVMTRMVGILTTAVTLRCPLRAEGHTGLSWKECK